MKQLVFLLLLGSTFGAIAQQPTRLSGTIVNPADDSVKLVLSNPVAGGIDSVYTAPIQEGSFVLQFSLAEPALLRFLHGREYTKLYLEPGDALSLSLDARQFDESLTFSGDKEQTNSLLARFLLSSFALEDSVRKQVAEKEPEAFKRWRNEKRQEQLLLLKENKEVLPDKLFGLLTAEADYSYGLSLMQYPAMKAYYSEDKKRPQLPDAYQAYKKELPLQNDALAGQSEQFDNYLFTLFFSRAAEAKTAGEAFVTILEKEIPQELRGATYNQMYARFLLEGIRYGEAERLQPLAEAYLQKEGTEAWRPGIRKVLEKAMLLAPGKTAPAFTLSSLEGDEVSLSDFAGKLVYLDFWASWCKPCLGEIPAAKALKQAFSDRKDVVFLYVSIDENEEAWRKMIEKKALEGIHLLSRGWSSKVAQEYQINAIPRYMLIDREGKIIDSNMSRPSHPETAARIREALQLQ